MMNIRLYLTFLGILLLSFTKVSAQVKLENLRCEMLENPLGIDVAQPRLSWQIVSSTRNTQQQAYQILVASSLEKLAANEGDLWDSGKSQLNTIYSCNL